AASSVRTMVLGWPKAFAGLPFNNLKEKTSKKVESAKRRLFTTACSLTAYPTMLFSSFKSLT
ncbi:MAG TPA: hypothetical protein VK369_16050, partial [Segetibacter sp.]|nr:hypothetical protein [Segetibacter sp.]